MARKPGRYPQAIEYVFFKHFKEGLQEFEFKRNEIPEATEYLGLDPIKNLGDLPYNLRYRSALPKSVLATAPKGSEWIIRPAGDARYRFCLVPEFKIAANPEMAETKIPDATPGIISRYALNDEQATLAKVRFNRLVDIFTGIVCYPLQSHLRTKIPDLGQVETDDVYVGLDKQGRHYVLPVQAKGPRDRVGVVQIEQDFALAATKFPELICKPIAAQLLKGGGIALYEFELTPDGVKVYSEKHYRLVPFSDLTDEEIKTYRLRTGE